ncbi:Protein argonaute MEL1 [Hordeum vulgare]|nr:Protein argonaute MEL1 [Hordeum vulgare]
MDKTARCSARRGSTSSSSLAPPSPPRATGNRPSCRSSSSCPPRRREATRPSSCGAPAGGRRGRPTTWRRVWDCVLHIRAYLTGHAYGSDLDLVAREASAYARAAATRDAAAADSTQAALELFDHREFDRWVETGEAPAIPSSLRQYREVRDLGFKTFLLTDRRVVCSFLIECPVQIIARANSDYISFHSVWIDHTVSINPESKSRAVNREVLSELIKVHDKTSLGSKLPAYDGRKSLYTAGSLPFESEEFSVTLVDAEKKDKERAEREYNITIRIVGRTDMYHLQQFPKGRQRDMPQETIQVLDDAGLCQCPDHSSQPLLKSTSSAFAYSIDIVMDKPGGEGAPKNQMIDC